MFSTCFVAFWFNCQIHTSLSSKIAFKKIEGNTSFEKKMKPTSEIIPAHCGYCVVGIQPDYE